MQIDSSTLSRLVALGRAKGQLTNEDLAEALPVSTMSASDIALVVVHLEESGVAVELDESLLTGRPSGPPETARTFDIVSAEKVPGLHPQSESLRAGSARELQAAVEPHAPEQEPALSAHRAVILAGVTALALLALVAFLLTP
jgi:hypothetical protein